MSAPISLRRRRLRRTIAMLASLLVVGASLGYLRQRATRPVEYRPDERPEDITSELARALPPEAPRPRLSDITAAAGLASYRNFSGTRTSQLPEDMGPGLAWGDFDSDGDDDLFLVGAGGRLDLPEAQLAPSVLYENLGDGTFRVATGFPEVRLHGLGAAWGDYDGDGFLDLVVVGYNAIRLFHNEGGTGRFVRDPRLPDPPGFWSGVAWGDYDGDRRLDLYVCHYVEYVVTEADRGKVSDQIGTAVPYTLNPAAFPGGRNALFHQGADGVFVDVAAELKVQNAQGRSLGAVWHDFDQDGWLDLYIANDVSDNVLFHNVGGRFEDLSHPAWVADYRSAMGLAVGDFDRDGDDDLHITHWVAQENALYENMWADLNGVAVRAGAFPSGVTNLAAAGSRGSQPLRFVDIADGKGLGQIALPFVGWGCEFADIDQDGWLDLLVANGSTIELEGPPPKRLEPQAAFLFWNQQGRFFHNLAPLHAGLSEPHVSRGLACTDVDGDGDLDFAITDLGEGVRLYRNDLAKGHSLKLRLRSRNATGQANGFGDGSTVIAWLGGVPLRRSVTGVSYLSPASHTLHWGLGDATRVDRLEVRWHAGATNVLDGLDADAFYEIVEGETKARKLSVAPTRLTGGPAAPAEASTVAASVRSATPDERRRQLDFWARQRAGMDAMKIQHDNVQAIRCFREAIALDPQHEDSRYYLGLCLASQGDIEAALVELEALQKLNPRSHRAAQQWGVVRAVAARNEADLAAAESALLRAQALNPEETGALLVLGEVALLRGQPELAEERLAAATRTNARAVGGLFLRGYLAWRRGDAGAAAAFLEQARQALGPDWKPKGSTGEGDVLRRQHIESTPLARYWEAWDGRADPAAAYAALAKALARAR